MEQAAVGVPGYVESLKRERDRFVALAFCAADLLFEVNSRDEISFAAGATLSLLGRNPKELNGTSFMDLLATGDRAMVRELISGMIPGTRLEPVPVQLNGANGSFLPLSLMGYHIPDLPGSHYFALRLGSAAVVGSTAQGLEHDPESGLLDRESFAEVAGKQIRSAAAQGETLKLTMFNTGALSDLRRRMGEESGRELMETLGSCLLTNSAGGQVAGRLDDDAYGFVHKAALDVAQITKRIEGIVGAADPEAGDISVKFGTVDADIGEITEADSVRVLLYTVNRFCETEAGDFDISSLGENVERMARETGENLNNFRALVRNGNFQMAFQPIVSLKDGDIHHFEVLARFNDKIDQSPEKVIAFAENTGIIADFDLAMCKRAIEWLLAANARNEKRVLAVNISGRSIANTAFVSALHDLLSRYRSMHHQIMFEITESSHIDDLPAADRFIQGLRQAGHQVCLDDFGAGSAALRYLHALEIDVVKIDGQYVRSASERPRNQAFLKAVVGLCHDLGITTIAEMVEDVASVRMLRSCGVQYGQGFLFGRPAFDISRFKTTHKEPEPDSKLGAKLTPRSGTSGSALLRS
ncbi:MAG: EAL domain-containing protein [Alphaproteobacteria bacterium]